MTRPVDFASGENKPTHVTLRISLLFFNFLADEPHDDHVALPRKEASVCWGLGQSKIKKNLFSTHCAKSGHDTGRVCVYYILCFSCCSVLGQQKKMEIFHHPWNPSADFSGYSCFSISTFLLSSTFFTCELWLSNCNHRPNHQSWDFFNRRTAETFLKYSNRSLQYFRNPTESTFHGPEAKVKVILEQLLTQENHVLEFWTSKKKRLDQTQQFCLFERSARQALAWIKEEGDIYLKTHTKVSWNMSNLGLCLGQKLFSSICVQNVEKFYVCGKLGFCL